MPYLSMHLEVHRDVFAEHYTTGKLSIDGVFQCHTLEDRVRNPGVKIPGATAIPAGTYPVMINWSKRFNRMMPLLLNVPEFTGVRIHWGNRAEDTEGCILVGQVIYGPGVLAMSKAAFETLFDKLDRAYDRGEVLSIAILDQREADPIAPADRTA